MKSSIVFPGQGTQYPKMGYSILQLMPELKRYYEQAETVLGRNLYEAVFTDDKSLFLQNPRDIQPAIFVTCIITYEYLKQKCNIQPIYLAGHSLGEIAALTASGAFTFEEGIRLVDYRSTCMVEDAKAKSGSMLSMVLEDDSMPLKYCEGKELSIACYNSPSQMVLAGEKEAVLKAEKDFKNMGIKTKILPTIGAFHTVFMNEAAAKVKKYVDGMEIHELSIPVMSNYTGKMYTRKEDVSKLLSLQINHTIKWKQIMQYFEQGYVSHVIEAGPGRTLTNMVRRDSKKMKSFGLDQKDELEKLKHLKQTDEMYVYRDIFSLCESAFVSVPVKEENYNLEKSMDCFEEMKRLRERQKNVFVTDEVISKLLSSLKEGLLNKGLALEQVNRIISNVVKESGIADYNIE